MGDLPGIANINMASRITRQQDRHRVCASGGTQGIKQSTDHYRIAEVGMTGGPRS